MGEVSKIAWTHSSYNHWWVCTEYGVGCQECYAREFASRFGYKWGKGAPRRFFGEKHNQEPYKWNKKAKQSGEEWRVFAMSMADWADDEVPQEKRSEFFFIVKNTPYLTWLLLTKRVANARRMLPTDWGDGYPNVRFGITCVNQKEADKDIPKMHEIPAQSYWISAEPQLSSIDYSSFLNRVYIDQIVTGGESGANARPYEIAWARETIAQCQEYKTAAFVKQLGARPVPRGGMIVGANYKWDEPEYWPEDLRVRNFPTTKGG